VIKGRGERMNERNISVNYRDTKNGYVLALCDIEHLGKRYKDVKNGDEIILDLETYRNFYDSNERKTVEEIAQFIKDNKMYIINAVGRRAVDVIISLGIASETEVMEIYGIPHVQVYYVRLNKA